jgi:hypothetical protein
VIHGSPRRPPLLGLFQQRVAGDDALLELARLRFAQAGLAAEAHADAPGAFDHVLHFAPAHALRPMVHLDRRIDVLRESGRAVVAGFAARFAGRVGGLVVHDQASMGPRLDDLVRGLRDLGPALGRGPDRPRLYLEYAAGHDLEWFVQLGERLRDVEPVSLCVDVGHVGVRHARGSFARRHPGLNLATLAPDDVRLPDLAADVQRAVASALPAVLGLTRSLGRTGKPLHFHLHDGHPLVPGLSDHFTFLMRLPIPFDHEGRRSLAPLYGPAGLSRILQAGIDACGVDRVSFTLEIHQVEGRLPLGDAAGLFRHWRDLTNAERTNHWLGVLAENEVLATTALDAIERDEGTRSL